MQISLLSLTALLLPCTLTTAIPHPQAIPTIPPSLLTNNPSLSLPTPIPIPTGPASHALNTTITKPPRPTRSKNPHWEPIPVFSKPCSCALATVRYPCWATDALQSCNFEENFSYGCYMEAVGGCPTPTRKCTALYKPTPRPGRHPCEGVVGVGPRAAVITG